MPQSLPLPFDVCGCDLGRPLPAKALGAVVVTLVVVPPSATATSLDRRHGTGQEGLEPDRGWSQ